MVKDVTEDPASSSQIPKTPGTETQLYIKSKDHDTLKVQHAQPTHRIIQLPTQLYKHSWAKSLHLSSAYP